MSSDSGTMRGLRKGDLVTVGTDHDPLHYVVMGFSDYGVVLANEDGELTVDFVALFGIIINLSRGGIRADDL